MQFKKLRLSGFPYPQEGLPQSPKFPCLRTCSCCLSLFPAWLQTQKVSAGMSISLLRASRPHRVPGPKSAQSLSYLLLLSGRKSKAGKSIPKMPVDSWWALGAGRETGKEGGVGEKDCTTKVGKIRSVRRWGPTFSLSPPYPRKGK